MTKGELKEYQSLERERRRVEMDLVNLETKLYSPRAPQLTGMPRAPHKHGGGLEATIATHIDKLEELRSHYASLIESLVAKQLEIEQAIESLDPAARTLMRYRYIDGLKWEEICVAMSYSWRSVHRLHASALIELKGERYGN